MNHVEVKRRQIQAISYMLGLVTLIVMGRIIGDNGIAYLAVAVESLSLFCLLLVHSVPDALARMLRGKNTRSQYKNVERIRKNVMLFQCIAGIAGSLLLFAMSDLLAEHIFSMPYSAFIIKVMSPVVLLRTVSSVFLGYFQGNGSQMPTSAASVIRQIFLFGFGLLFCNILKNYGVKVSALLLNEDFTSMYGAVGLAIAMILTEALVLLFLFLIYLGNDRRKEKNYEGLKMTETFSGSVSSLYRNRSNDLLISVLARLPVWLGILFYQRSVLDIYTSAMDYGIYYGKYLVVCAFPILFCSMFLLPMSARINSYVRREEHRLGGELFGAAVHLGAVCTLFGVVFIAVMSRQIAGSFFSGNTEAVAEMLKFGSSVVLFIVLSYLFIRILLIGGKNYLVMCALGVFNIIFILGLMLFLHTIPKGIAGLVYAGVLGSGILCLATGFFALRLLRVSMDIIRWVVIPVIAAGVMGVICMLLGNVLTPHLDNLVTLLVCLAIGIIGYWIILLLLRSFQEQELELLPGGAILMGIARLLHVI